MTAIEKLIQNIWNGVRDDEFGQNGFQYITNTTATPGNWKTIKCITNCEFTALTTSKGAPGTKYSVPQESAETS